MANGNGGRPDPTLIGLVAAAVIAGWFASIAIAVFRSEYTALSITTPIMALLAGYAFTYDRWLRQRKGGDQN